LESLSSIGLVGAFIGGLVSFFSPCTLPLLPAYLSVVTGGSAGKADRRLEALTLSAFFVFGFSIVFILLGLGASSIGQLMRGYRQEFNWVAGSAVIVLGLFMTGVFRLPLFQRTFQFTPQCPGWLSAFGDCVRGIFCHRLDALYRPHPGRHLDGHVQCC
jgi:cytochrome c-type biogenesis protein